MDQALPAYQGYYADAKQGCADSEYGSVASPRPSMGQKLVHSVSAHSQPSSMFEYGRNGVDQTDKSCSPLELDSERPIRAMRALSAVHELDALETHSEEGGGGE